MSKRSINSPIKCYPLINTIQRITVYETIHSIYVVGANPSETVFKVIKIDRTGDPRTLCLSEDLHEYDRYEIKELISMINIDQTSQGGVVTSRLTSSSSSNNVIIRKIAGHMLVGFIKFTEGYYMLLVTKQTPVAILGYHVIYTIDDVAMIYVPYVPDRVNSKEVNLDEQKYLKMFQSIDLRQNFYYSFTYDLTNTLQNNQSEIRHFESSIASMSESKIVGVKNKACMKFVWNEFLLRPCVKNVSYQWIVYLVHGFLAQSSLNIFGCSVFVTLIARRSQKYAGTRFLKRGGTNEGYVANEVETEQIVHNASVSSFSKGFFTSFVHTRGSIPLFWSQDPKQVPKPPIIIDIVDPFATLAARHFRQLMSRHGAPIIILNLVKMREKRPQESMLAEEYKICLDYLKQFLPNENYIEYICFDMAKLNKTDKGNVMARLYEIAEDCVSKTSFFRNFSASDLNNDQAPYSSYSHNPKRKFRVQTGIVRVNCVDCLDRTNTAMYVIGKCALAHQLYSLGILPSPKLGVDSVCERMLIELYEKCGDSIAQQYAGSQLVHRVDTYGKNTLATSSRDMYHTLSRYYSNAFADADKQNAMNIFLGIFEPSQFAFPIWELASDSYLHDLFIMQPWRLSKRYSEWLDSRLFKCLPLPFEQQYKSFESFSQIEQFKTNNDAKISLFDNLYEPYRLTAFHDIFYFNNLNTNRITNNAPGLGFGGNIKAMLVDPFIYRKKSSPSQSNKTTPANQSLSTQTSSDDDLTDESFTIIQANNNNATFKQAMFKERQKPSLVNQSSQIKSNKIYIELSERSLDIYKAYAESKNNELKPFKPYVQSLFKKQDSSYSIGGGGGGPDTTSSKSGGGIGSTVSNTSVFRPPEWKTFSSTSSDYAKFDLDTALNSPPFKYLSEANLGVYMNFLNVGYGGSKEPSEKSIQLYEEFCK